VIESDGTCTASIPALTERDRSMARELRVLGRQARMTWMDERYEQLSTDLVGLTLRGHGVTLSHNFWWEWSRAFAVANRELVAEGLCADPYDPKPTFEGFIPAGYPLEVVRERF
jgi:hypothetical protein